MIREGSLADQRARTATAIIVVSRKICSLLEPHPEARHGRMPGHGDGIVDDVRKNVNIISQELQYVVADANQLLQMIQCQVQT